MSFGQWMRKRVNSFGFAIQGIVTLFSTQTNAIIHLVITALVITFGIFFTLSRAEWILIVVCIAIVLAAEAFNSAIEFLADHVTKEKHPSIKKVKDLAAGAVLITATGAAIVGLTIFLPYLYGWFKAL